jgi:hypothetical protein
MASAYEVGGSAPDTDLIFEMLKHHVLSLHPHNSTKEKKREKKKRASTFFFGWGLMSI